MGKQVNDGPEQSTCALLDTSVRLRMSRSSEVRTTGPSRDSFESTRR